MGKFLLPFEIGVRAAASATYVFGVTIALLVLIFILALNPEASPIATTTVDGAFGLLYVLAVSYLTANVVDKSKVLDGVGTGFKNRGTVNVMTPEDVRRMNSRPEKDESDTYG